MQAGGETDAETCAYNDLALIELDPADVAKVNPSIPKWGGPTGVGTAAALGDVYSYGNSSLRQGITQLSPKRGKVVEVSDGGWSYSLYTLTPGIPGDSGSAFLNADGQALGVLSTVAIAPLPLSNGVGDVGKEIAYARAHGFSRPDARQRHRALQGRAADRVASQTAASGAPSLRWRPAWPLASSPFPATASGPRSSRPTVDLLQALRPRRRGRGAPLRRRLDRRPRHRADRRGRSPRARRADAVLLAAVGGPKWDTTDPTKPRPEQGLLGLRKGLGLYANLRPVRPLPALYDASPLRREIIDGTDLLVVRELTGGIYFGEKTRTETTASRPLRLHRRGDRAHRPHRLRGRAQRKVTSVDKANVLETSRLWRQTVVALHARGVPRRHARARPGRQRRDAARLQPDATST